MKTSLVGRALVVIAGVLGMACPLRAAEESVTVTVQAAAKEAQAMAEKAEEAAKRVTVMVSAAGGSHWLGLLTVPVDEGLKSQLKLDDRLIVQQVVPDSPAAKAGIKQHDILLKIGDTEIHQLPDLMQWIEKNADKETKLTVLREGEEQSVTIKPEKRPAGGELQITPEIAQLREKVNVWLQGKGGVWRPDQSIQMQFVGPGFVGVGGKFPEDLSISVIKDGAVPAQISVKRKDEKWEVTEESLDKLPADVRPHVERLLGRGNVMYRIAPGGMSGSVFAVPPVAPGVPPVPVTPPDGVRKSIEMRHEIHADKGMKELRKEMQELRKELDALKAKSGKPAEDKK